MNGNLSAVFYIYYCALPNNIHTQNGYESREERGEGGGGSVAKQKKHTTIQVSEMLSYALCVR